MKVAIVMGSKSDFEAVKPAVDILKQFGVECEARVISAHRTPEEAHAFAKSAAKNKIEVIVAAAGKAAHLAGVLASCTTLPVIGLPVKSSFEDGLDSLLSTVQMPSGIPVATVAVGGGENAGLLAARILSVKYPALRTALKDYAERLRAKTLEDDRLLRESVK
ncbi:MAG: 5-(carboxyamino)imidazole ribonucleotide mutase [Clostridiales bacterium]|jgi:5-(carboxyamino)imidazole ribonucleotide mutase|nr:5-(carboxyamino)imidazole ribonucleotide mutase [Clostridiales bacterium]